MNHSDTLSCSDAETDAFRCLGGSQAITNSIIPIHIACAHSSVWRAARAACLMRLRASAAQWGRRGLIEQVQSMTALYRILAIGLTLLMSMHGSYAADDLSPTETSAAPERSAIAPYEPRFGRTRPVVAVIGDNAGTVAADFLIPYGVLAASELADVVSVATRPGLLRLGSLKVSPEHSSATFDAAYAQGADYVFVPAVTDPANPELTAWVASQAAKGATLVGICNGSLVLANAGVTKGHVATGHWSTHERRLKEFPDTHWVKNVRYVVDGKVVSSAGITAALPTSIAVVEAIGGTAHAADLARRLGVGYWGTSHDSDAFRLEILDYLVGAKNAFLMPKDIVGLPVSDGVDEIAVALASEAYEDTLRARVRVVAQKDRHVRTRGGLTLLADSVEGDGSFVDYSAPAFDNQPAGELPGQLLGDITRRYGARAARFVALDWEYPDALNATR